MKSYLYIVSFVVVLYYNSAFPQNDQSVVAQIGNDKITLKEFKIRQELIPYIPENKNIDPDSIKFNFLYSWIAEKLWAEEAERLGFASTNKFKFYFKPLEDLFVRDALFKKEIEQNTLLNAKDINNGIMKSQFKLIAEMIIASDSMNIFNFYDKINTGLNFDSLLSLNKNLNVKDVEIKLGSLADEEIEDSLYALKIGQCTQPIKSEIGWVVFILKNKVLTPIDITNKGTIKNIESVIKERRIRKRYEEYLKKLLSNITVVINPVSFNFISDIVWNRLKQHFSTENRRGYYELAGFDYEDILRSVPESDLDETLFNISDKKINLKSFLSQLAFDGFSSDKLDSIYVLQKLKRRVKQFVESQLITNEAYAQRLDLSEDVRQDLSKWREKYLSQFYLNAVQDSIKTSESDLKDFYQNELKNKSNLTLINVRVLNISGLDTIASILDQIKEGKEFGEIIKSFGQTDTLVNSDGETGLRPIISLGYIGSIANNLKINEVYGPIQRNRSYTLLEVIEKKGPDDSVKISYSSIKNQLREKLRLKILTEKLNRKTAQLAEKNNVKVFSNVVNEIKNSEIPMFVHRLMGFGGRISAVPLLTPFSDWIKSVNKQKLLP